MPDAAADSGLSAFDTSIHAQTLSAFVSCARNDRARAVLPEHSAPIISVTAPNGSPPSRTASIAAIPVGATSRIVFAAGVSADGILAAKAASIWVRRAAADRIVFALYSPIGCVAYKCFCNDNCAESLSSECDERSYATTNFNWKGDIGRPKSPLPKKQFTLRRPVTCRN
jgi:type IV pilus biogenesis protein CpaD/CtpE